MEAWSLLLLGVGAAPHPPSHSLQRRMCYSVTSVGGAQPTLAADRLLPLIHIFPCSETLCPYYVRWGHTNSLSVFSDAP